MFPTFYNTSGVVDFVGLPYLSEGVKLQNTTCNHANIISFMLMLMQLVIYCEILAKICENIKTIISTL